MSEELHQPNVCKLDKVFEAVNVASKVEGKSLKKEKFWSFKSTQKEDHWKGYSNMCRFRCCSSMSWRQRITDLDIIEVCTLNHDLPHYNPLSHTGKEEICNALRLNVRVSLGTHNLNIHMSKHWIIIHIAGRTVYLWW